MFHYRLKYNGKVYSTKRELLRYVQDGIFPEGVLLKVDDLDAEYMLILGKYGTGMLHTAVSTIFSVEVVTDEAILSACFDCLISNAHLVPAGVSTFVLNLGNISSESNGNVFCRVFIDGIEMSYLTVDYLIPGTDKVFLTEEEAEDYVKKLRSRYDSACKLQVDWKGNIEELLRQHCVKNPYNLLDSDSRLMFLLSRYALNTADSCLADEDCTVYRDNLERIINEAYESKMHRSPSGDAVTAEDVLQYFLSKQESEADSPDSKKVAKTQKPEPDKAVKVQESDQKKLVKAVKVQGSEPGNPVKPQEAEHIRGTEPKVMKDSQSQVICCDCLPYILNNTTGNMVAVVNVTGSDVPYRIYVTSGNFGHLKALCEVYFGEHEITCLMPLSLNEKVWVEDYLSSSDRIRGLVCRGSDHFIILDDTCKIRRRPYEV